MVRAQLELELEIVDKLTTRTRLLQVQKISTRLVKTRLDSTRLGITHEF
jgi:hypothetical protein